MNRGVQLDQDWGSEDESHLAKIPTLTTSTALKREFESAQYSGRYDTIQVLLVNTFSSWKEMILSFKDHLSTSQDNEYDHNIDMNFVHYTYCVLLQMPSDVQKSVLKAIITGLLKESEERQKTKDHLRPYIVLIENPQFRHPATYVIFAHLLRQLSLLSEQYHRLLVHWFRSYHKDRFQSLVSKVNQFISVRLFPPNPNELPAPVKCSWWIPSAIKILALLNAANNLEHPPLIPYTSFYNPALDHTDLMTEYYAWQSPQGFATMRFSFCHYPFVLSMSAKKMILQKDSEHQMLTMAKKSLMEKAQRHQVPTLGNLFLNLRIRRSHIVQDSLNELISKRHDLKKKVKVTFAGEPGLDWGGLTKEWFLLLVRKIFQPDFGMFVPCKEKNTYWFNMASIDSESEFHLVGILMGLAVYNSTILDIHLPPCCYKKLLSPPTPPNRSKIGPVGVAEFGLHDLEQVMPTLSSNLRSLLEYTGDVEEDLCYSFQISYQAYDFTYTVELKPGGKDKRVTSENREEFVSLYIDYLLNKSIYKQFASFYYGFHRVCASNSLQLFSPEEVELLVCGTPLVDLAALEDVTMYDGYSKSDASVRNFWEVANSLSIEQQRKLLMFTTGSDRVPVGGITEMNFKISKLPFPNQTKTEILPMAHTCFNQLLLPPYKSRRKLKDKLLVAINNAEGFGME
jgi:E3 ubiquitin-protein ligase HECTD2